MIITGAGTAPGYVRCNRQWSHRFTALMDAYQDVIRLIAFGGDSNSLQVFNGVKNLSPVNVAQIGGPFSGRD